MGIESEESKLIGKTEYQWHNLIIVRWQKITDTVAYWTEVCFCMEMPSEKNPHEKLAGFAQRILCSQYHNVMQKWNKYSTR